MQSTGNCLLVYDIHRNRNIPPSRRGAQYHNDCGNHDLWGWHYVGLWQTTRLHLSILGLPRQQADGYSEAKPIAFRAASHC